MIHASGCIAEFFDIDVGGGKEGCIFSRCTQVFSPFTGIAIFSCDYCGVGFHCELVVCQSISGKVVKVVRGSEVVVLGIMDGVKRRSSLWKLDPDWEIQTEKCVGKYVVGGGI